MKLSDLTAAVKARGLTAEDLVALEEDRAQDRKFETGAIRSANTGRYDPEGYLSPLVIEAYSEYMLKHQVTASGDVRSSDNWQKGMSNESYMQGAWRHFLHAWMRTRGYEPKDPKASPNLKEDLCALLFNVMGRLHNLCLEDPPEQI